MSKNFKFIVPGVAKAKSRPRLNIKTGIIYTPQKTLEYEKLIGLKYLESGGKYLGNEAIVHITAQIHTKQPKRAKFSDLITRPDVDNVLKILMDGLTGIAYADDSQVTDTHIFRIPEVEEPYVAVTLEAYKQESEDEKNVAV
jgi:Holliday junction resolvase RusA-like endonuclease